MIAEIEDLERRLELLLGGLEAQLDMVGQRVTLVSSTQLTVASDQRAGSPGDDAILERLELMLRSVVLHQGGHTSDLRQAVRYLERLVERAKRDGRS